MAQTSAAWLPDILGPGFEQLSIPLGEDDEGELKATLVRANSARQLSLKQLFKQLPATDVDVLYVHGWADYFFQKHLAWHWSGLGAKFFALDLRKYGRSLLPGQTPGYITDLKDYDAEIEAALELIGHGKGTATKRKLILMGHSTGGLTLSLWANRNPGRATALILNSPWLEFQARSFIRTAIKPLVALSSTLDPKDKLPNLDLGFYAKAVKSNLESDLFIDDRFGSEVEFYPRPAWLSAILAGHEEVAAGLQIDCPVLVQLSNRSVLKLSWDDLMTHADTVLDVEVVSRRALKLGNLVTLNWIPGALHDVFLSEKSIRQQAFDQLDHWLTGYLNTPNL